MYCYCSWGGPSAFGVCTLIYALVFPYIFLLNSEEITLFYDSVDQGGPSAFESQWHQWTVKRSLCALAVLTGGSICLWCPYLYICTGISWYFLIEQWRDYSVLWQCWLGGSICLWCPYLYICTGIHLPLVSTCFLYALVFPYIFLLFDCFELALIGDIEKCRVHSACWQF